LIKNIISLHIIFLNNIAYLGDDRKMGGNFTSSDRFLS